MNGAPWPSDDPRWDDESATVRFGPPPPPALPRPSVSPPHARWARWAGVALIGLAVGLGAVVSTGWRAAESSSPGSPPTTGSLADTSSGACPDVPSTSDRETRQVLVIETGARCPEVVTYDRSSALLDLGDEERYLVGEPGDLLLVGDWDCDGAATPALYRPDDGRTFQFSAWADGTTVASATAGVAEPHGTPRVVHRDGCDHLVVEAPA